MGDQERKEGFDLATYLNNGMDTLVRDFLGSAGPRYAWAFRKAKKIRERLSAQGHRMPAFLITSITTRCNLFCAGCYARANEAWGHTRDAMLSTDNWARLFREARECGIPFILLAGGEPLLRMDVLEQAARVKEILFPVFTNGTLLGEPVLKLLTKNRHLVPMLSLEGGRVETDGRRSPGTYDALLAAMEVLKRRKLFFGVSVTVTTANLSTVTGPEFHHRLAELGCRAVLFVEYVPMNPATETLAPTDVERQVLARGQARLRQLYPRTLFLSFPGDEKEAGGCLAAGRGFFHISADGAAEPCPFSPYSDTNLRDRSLTDALSSPLFRRLEESGWLSGNHAGGCVLAQKEAEVKALL